MPTQQNITEKEVTLRPLDNDDASVISIPANRRQVDPSTYFTDTSEVEDSMNSSGVGGPVTPQAKGPHVHQSVNAKRGSDKWR